MNSAENRDFSLKKLVSSQTFTENRYFLASFKPSATFLKSFRVQRAPVAENLSISAKKLANQTFCGKDFSYASYLIRKNWGQSS